MYMGSLDFVCKYLSDLDSANFYFGPFIKATRAPVFDMVHCSPSALLLAVERFPIEPMEKVLIGNSSLEKAVRKF